MKTKNYCKWCRYFFADLPFRCCIFSCCSCGTISPPRLSSNIMLPLTFNLVPTAGISTDHQSLPNLLAHLLPSPVSKCAWHQDLILPSNVTPIKVKKIKLELSSHPDHTLVDYVISGLGNGFHLGFNAQTVLSRSATLNMPSSSLQPTVTEQNLLMELDKGHTSTLQMVTFLGFLKPSWPQCLWQNSERTVLNAAHEGGQCYRCDNDLWKWNSHGQNLTLKAVTILRQFNAMIVIC